MYQPFPLPFWTSEPASTFTHQFDKHQHAEASLSHHGAPSGGFDAPFWEKTLAKLPPTGYNKLETMANLSSFSVPFSELEPALSWLGQDSAGTIHSGHISIDTLSPGIKLYVPFHRCHCLSHDISHVASASDRCSLIKTSGNRPLGKNYIRIWSPWYTAWYQIGHLVGFSNVLPWILLTASPVLLPCPFVDSTKYHLHH